MDHSDTIRSYMEALEEERQKIEVFRRELPLCLELVKQAIVGCKLQLSGASTEVMLHGQLECNSEQTTTGAHVLEEFIPLKSSRSHDGDYVEEDDDVDNDDEEQHSQMKKSDWLRSVQLWNPSPDSTPKEGPARPPPPKKAPLPAAEAKNHRGSNGAFHPLNKDIKAAGGKINNSSNSDSKQQLSGGDASPAADRTASSTAGGGAGCGPKKEEKQGQRKQRRCWSQELHRRFLHALQQLGGSHATPKQIRELMRVDGLTNDEVKSHLQKYRLHVRRPSAPVQNVNTLAPQFVVVGGIWMSPQDFTAAAASTKSVAEVAAANGMYAPVATVPQPFKQLHKKPQSMMNSDERSCEEEGVDHHSHSPPTSTSTHTSAEC